jgi:hypothetical protein
MNSNKEYSANMKRYFEILNKHKILKNEMYNEENKKPTHTSLGDPKGSYDFSGEKNNKLQEIYT